MATEIEIEFKCLLSEEKYLELLNVFNINRHDIFEQINYYFNINNVTEAIRVRLVNNVYTFTHKQKLEKKIIETNQLISKDDFTALIKHGLVPRGEVFDVIKKEVLEYVTFSTTKRVFFPYLSGYLFLDHTIFEQDEDFEVEFEVSDYHIGLEDFDSILNDFNIPYMLAVPKIQRAYKSIKNK